MGLPLFPPFLPLDDTGPSFPFFFFAAAEVVRRLERDGANSVVFFAGVTLFDFELLMVLVVYVSILGVLATRAAAA